MFRNLNCFCTQIAIGILFIKTCNSEPQTPYLALYSPRDTEYTDVLVRRVHDNLTLVCEVRGDPAPRVFVWNYVSDDNSTDGGRPLAAEPWAPGGGSAGSRLQLEALRPADSGHYICSAPPFSTSKHVLVQPKGPHHCARGAFWCGARCVLPAYVCDGRKDCVHAEDEAPPLCAPRPCARADKLNCSSGRCIPQAACCRPGAALCRQPACCDEHARYSTLEGYVEVEYPPLFEDRRAPDEYGFIQSTIYTVTGYVEVEYPPLFEDRRAPDEYGFIQSTIYTVTACALIFMIAVVLLVSALCKMHMKRAALRGYASAHRDTAHHYAARYPPRYEAAHLLEPGPTGTLATSELPSPETPSTVASEAPPYGGGFGLARLSAIFSSRYRQVPTQCCDVEMSGLRTPPERHPPCAATPLELFRRRTCRAGAAGDAPRPGTPDVEELQLELVRAPGGPTYTLHGRSVRLLGAAFARFPEPAEPAQPAGPPPYNEAVRYKCDPCGPPPHYLSREAVNDNESESEARTNVELPPCYEELEADATNANIANIANITINVIDTTDNNVADNENGNNVTRGKVAGCDAAASSIAGSDVTFNHVDRHASGNINTGSNVTTNILTDTNVNDNDLFVSNDNVPETISSVIDNLPAIDSDVNANEMLCSVAAIDT